VTTERAAPAWSGRQVLVTGAAGFIGSHLAERLARNGARVRAFVRYNSRNDYGWLETLDPDVLDQVEVFRGDLANPEAVARAMSGCEVVFHLGALIPIPYSYVHPREFLEANIVGTLNVVEAARRVELARIVHISTSEVYGTAREVPINERHSLNAQSPYAATKSAADQLALSYWRSFSIPVAVARPFNTFGPRQSARAVIPTIITQALSRDVIELGSTHTTRDFLFVEDTAAGIEACGQASGIEGEVINLGSGQEISIAEVVERVLAIVGRDVPVAADSQRVRPDNSEVERLIADRSKALELLGWEPQVDLDEGLRRTIEWIQAVPELYKPSLYNV
jgi:NAD dependent epimerase/dehydratase